MMLDINGQVVRTSDKIDKLPKEFVDFAIEHRSTNGNYYWDRACDRCISGSPSYRLEDIELIDRMWSYIDNVRALSLCFHFTIPDRSYIGGDMSNEEKDAYCYKHGFIRYDHYFTNLTEGVDIYPFLVDIDLKYAFLFNLKDFIKHWN